MPAVSEPYSLPAPVGGLNAQDALANMPETDAIILDNWFPQPSWVEMRNGTVQKATFTGTCETLCAYNGLSANKLFAAVNNAGTRSIYDATSGGALSTAVVGGAGNTVQAITSTQYDWAQFGTASANVLVLVNGKDTPLQYDGTSWIASTLALSGGPASSTLNTVAVYKSRLWFSQANSFNVWYTATGTYTGNCTQLPLASYFKLGGYIQAIVTISIDNAGGTNDYIAFVSSIGEVIVYTGTDPSSTSTWSLSAHFRIGQPVATGRRCWTKIGSDALIISADGFAMLSEALLTDRSQTNAQVSKKIRKSVTDAVTQYGSNFGWQVILYPIGNKVIVNVPVSQGTISYQYVMNTLTGAWCTFGLNNTPWNAVCFELLGNNIYYGQLGAIYQCDIGQSDNGNVITVDCLQAFSYFGARGGIKNWKMMQPIMTVSGNVSLNAGLNLDYDETAPSTLIPVSMANNPLWGANNLWNTPTYWGGQQKVLRQWFGIGGVGYCAAPRIRISGSGVDAQWAATNFLFEKGAAGF